MIKLLKTTLTSEDMQKLVEASNDKYDSTNGYYVEYWERLGNKYIFIGWARITYIPKNTDEFIINKRKDNVFLYVGNSRYTLTNSYDEINELLNIWEEV